VEGSGTSSKKGDKKPVGEQGSQKKGSDLKGLRKSSRRTLMIKREARDWLKSTRAGGQGINCQRGKGKGEMVEEEPHRNRVREKGHIPFYKSQGKNISCRWGHTVRLNGK